MTKVEAQILEEMQAKINLFSGAINSCKSYYKDTMAAT